MLSEELVDECFGLDDQVLVPIGGAQKDSYHTYWGFDKLYDGSTSTDLFGDTCYHSASEFDGWVEVTLDDVYKITRIGILKRGDLGTYRISCFVVFCVHSTLPRIITITMLMLVL